MSFDPKKHLIKVQGGKEYLPVSARLVWFRTDHPDWGIVTEPIEINLEKQYAIFKAMIFNAEGKLIATATKMENVRGFADYIEKAETSAVGRALAYAGYGTQFAPEIEEEAARAASRGRGAGAAARSLLPPAPGGAYRREHEEPEESGNPFDDPPAPSSADLDLPNTGSDTSSAESDNPSADRCAQPGCNAILSSGEATYSMNNYGVLLCREHRKGVPKRKAQ